MNYYGLMIIVAHKLYEALTARPKDSIETDTGERGVYSPEDATPAPEADSVPVHPPESLEDSQKKINDLYRSMQDGLAHQQRLLGQLKEVREG